MQTDAKKLDKTVAAHSSYISKPPVPPVFIHGALIFICFFLALPVLYAIVVATLSATQFYGEPGRILPGGDLWANISELFKTNFFQTLANTVIISLIVLIAKTGTSLLAGLAFVYFSFPGKWFLFFFVLLTLLMPTEIIVVPLFNIINDLGWSSNMLGLTVPFFASATGAFLFRQHFMNIPTELAEAAQLDGAGPLRFLWSILVPISWNVIGAMAVIQFIYMWNQYLWPRVIIQSVSSPRQMIQVGVTALLSVEGIRDFGPAMAGAIVATIPPLVVFVMLQRQFMNGFALTREK